MGFDAFTAALADDPDLVARLFEKVGSIQWEVFQRLLDIPAIGAIWHPDDIAYTEGLIVNPRLLRQHVFPWYKRMGEVCRARGIPYLYHTDGDVTAVLDDIVACGFNALHPLEPKAMDIVAVKRQYGDRLCLIGNIDLSYTLTRGTPEEVDAEVKERIRTLAPGGGYCVSSSNSVTEYVPFANYQAMREATLKYGKYPIKL
jgi:uroporphyrinogen decarboxylase